MDKVIYLNNLYDYYGVLLNERQQEIFKYYYFDNLSLSEISENENISRNAISKQLKNICLKLNDYETKLGLYKKTQELNKIIANLDKETNKKIKEIIGG